MVAQSAAAAAAAEVTFTVNGLPQTVCCDGSAPSAISATTSLADYLRLQARLPGTKTMCREGMCGACVVTVTSADPATGQRRTRAVNACLAPVLNCHGWQITTVEGIGSTQTSPHPVQSRLAKMHGTQCGYCTPGMVMAMYSELESGRPVTTEGVESALEGHLCRCTGYRPILDAFRTFAEDTPAVQDIEDSAGGCANGAKEHACTPSAACVGCPRVLSSAAAADTWRQPDTLAAALRDVTQLTGQTAGAVRLVAGNTASGVLDKYDPPAAAYISLLNIPELHAVVRPSSGSPRAVFGAAVAISDLALELELVAASAGFRHCAEMARHLRLIANTPVRNAATWAGNLMIRHKHREFGSDVFLLLAAAGAVITVASQSGVEEMGVEQLYEISMEGKIIVSMSLSPLDDEKYVFKAYKVSPRACSAHAYISAAFLFPYDAATGTVTERPRILYAGVSDDFCHAVETERLLAGRRLAEAETLQMALSSLQAEVAPLADPELADPEYRRTLAVNLLYKMVLHVLGASVPAPLRSGAASLERPPMSGQAEFETDEQLWPVNQPVPKLEAAIQTTGEAQFTDDQPPVAGELHGAFVLSTVGSGTIQAIDACQALALPGVCDLITAQDIKGRNDYIAIAPFTAMFGVDRTQMQKQLIFADGRVEYCGQPVALLVAESRELAVRAARLVDVQYADVVPPTTSLRQALQQQPDAQELNRRLKFPGDMNTGDADEAMKAAAHRVSGEFEMGGQHYHFLENHAVRVAPRDDDQLDVTSSTQCIKEVAVIIGRATGLPMHRINVSVPRVGGGFGGKEWYPAPLAAAVATAARKLRTPVRVALDMESSLLMFGGRFPHLMQYEVGFDAEGRISALRLLLVSEQGVFPIVSGAVEHAAFLGVVRNTYAADNWRITPALVTTHLAPNCSCRAPGCVNAVTTIEVIMEHIAHALGRDPWQVRCANFAYDISPDSRRLAAAGSEVDVFGRTIDELFASADIERRKADIAQFNKAHRWRKRGLAVQPMCYHIAPFFKMPCLVSIYDVDGTVAVSSGGVEMGQGLNTKVAQTVARELGVPLELISVKWNNSLVNPNGNTTGGSIGSETCSFAAQQCARTLMSRLEPYRTREDGSKRTWVETVQAASDAAVNLTAHAMRCPDVAGGAYIVWGAAAADVLLDVLTGESSVLRVDLVEDAGQPLSPGVDLGQVEGAFTFGMGLHLLERQRVHPQTARRITNRCWNYFIPTHKDMPRDFRVKLLKNGKNPPGIFNSKATGEPALCLSGCTLNALRAAVVAARADRGLADWPALHAPATPEVTLAACAPQLHQLTLC